MRHVDFSAVSANLARLALCSTLVLPVACDMGKKNASEVVVDAQKITFPDTQITEHGITSKQASVKYKSSVDGVHFRCSTTAVDAEPQFTDCPDEGVSIQLLEAREYAFRVKAVTGTGVEDQTPAEIIMNGADGTITDFIIDGAEKLGAQRGGKVDLTFIYPAPATFTCLIDSAAVACDEARYQVDLDTLTQGSHKMVVTAATDDGKTEAKAVNFCAKSCDPAGSGGGAGSTGSTDGSGSATGTGSAKSGSDALADDLQIGDFYSFNVDDGMHVTEYSTTKTTGVLSFFRVMPQSDVTYLGNYKCDKEWDSIVSSHSPLGQSIDYCHSTPTREEYKVTNESRLANNHVEIATDASRITPTNNQRLSVSVYDADWEFMTMRSRFKNLCANAAIHVKRIPMVNDFFYGRLPEEANFWMCDAIIPARNGASEMWKIGAFIDIDELDWNCRDCAWDRAVEVVYMARPGNQTWRDDYFAKSAQEAILKRLTKIQP